MITIFKKTQKFYQGCKNLYIFPIPLKGALMEAINLLLAFLIYFFNLVTGKLCESHLSCSCHVMTRDKKYMLLKRNHKYNQYFCVILSLDLCHSKLRIK